MENERQNIATWREITELISDTCSVFDCHLVVILGTWRSLQNDDQACKKLVIRNLWVMTGYETTLYLYYRCFFAYIILCASGWLFYVEKKPFVWLQR